MSSGEGSKGASAGIAIDGSNDGFGVEFGPHNRCAAPLPVGLSRLTPGYVTMQTKNMHDDVFRHHGIAAGRLDLAERCIWQLWMVDKGFDPGRAAEHGFQIRKDQEGIR